MPEFDNVQWSLENEMLGAKVGSKTPQMLGASPPYKIKPTRVFDEVDRAGVQYYEWPVHMAQKTWVDIEQFIEVFEAAIRSEAERSGKSIDRTMLQRSFQYARVENARVRASS